MKSRAARARERAIRVDMTEARAAGQQEGDNLSQPQVSQASAARCAESCRRGAASSAANTSDDEGRGVTIE